MPDDLWGGAWRDWIYNIDVETDSFTGGHWGEPVAIEAVVPRERPALKQALKASYHARSGLVHTGGRDIRLSSEMTAMAQPPTQDHLSFVALHLLLRALIDIELSRADDNVDHLPPLVFTDGNSEI